MEFGKGTASAVPLAPRRCWALAPAVLLCAFRETDLGERIQNVLGKCRAARPVGNRGRNPLGIFIVGAIVEQPAVLGLPHSAPLLEEKRNVIFPALIAHRDHPFLPHWPGPGSALATNNCPTDAREIEFAETLQQRFYGKKADACRCILQMADPRQTILLV